jgi:hypothetical protein
MGPQVPSWWLRAMMLSMVSWTQHQQIGEKVRAWRPAAALQEDAAWDAWQLHSLVELHSAQ